MNNSLEHIEFENSSTIISVDYDYLMENLDVHFRNGGTYRFCGVPKTILEEIKSVESIGKYFHQNIKNKFDFIKK